MPARRFRARASGFAVSARATWTVEPATLLFFRTPTRLHFDANKCSIFHMTPATKHKPTDGALRAAKQIERDSSFIHSTAETIDRETGVRELVEMLENIIAEAGDLIESRSPELVAQARAALHHFGDEAPRPAE